MAEYRLEELAHVSGVSSRNIRAYRERGLLDAPRRDGRASVYDEHHLAQLKTISDLLHRGFSSAHIGEFFTSVREGRELADLLGLQQVGRRPEATPVRVDPASSEVQRTCAAGLARLVDGHLTFANSDIGAIVAGADDPLDYLRALLRVHDATAVSAAALEESIAARSDGAGELGRRIADYRALADHVAAEQLDAVVARRLPPGRDGEAPKG